MTASIIRLSVLLSLSVSCSGFVGSLPPSSIVRWDDEFSVVTNVRAAPISRSAGTSHFALRKKSLAVIHADSRRGRSKTKGSWPRRVWSRILRRQDLPPAGRGEQALQMQPATLEAEEQLMELSQQLQDERVVRDIEELATEMVLPEISPAEIDSVYSNVALHPRNSAPSEPKLELTAVTDNEQSKRASPSTVSVARLAANRFESSLSGIIHGQSSEPPEGLTIQSFPRGNTVAGLVRGKFETDAKIAIRRLVFPLIRMSGGSLEIKRMTTNVVALLQGPEKRTMPRFPEQFELHIDNLTFSRHDLLFSRCIMNGLRRLLERVMKDRGVLESSLKVTSVDILSNGKISCRGEAKTLIGSALNFEVRTSVSFSSRGHVLTFPGLEVSLNRDIGLFVPVVPEIDLDVGHNTQFRSIDIDGAKKTVSLSAKVTITPESTLQLNQYQQSKESFSARFCYDVGQWLTKIGNFSK